MKQRMGFVSNSSSSSFCILGMKAKELWLENCQECIEKWNEACNEVYANLRESFLETVEGIEEYSGTFVGVSIDTYGSRFADKTPNEMKQIIADEIKKVFYDDTIKAKDIQFFVDGGYDG